MPQGAVYRRRQVNLALDKGERVVYDAIKPVLEQRFKTLARDLRKANLRKRLRKNGGELYKAGDPTGESIWKKWFSYFTKTLTQALEEGAGFVWDVNQRYFVSQKYSPFPYNGKEVLKRYLSVERNDTRITDISKYTEKQVSEIIAKWYKTDAGLPELVDLLEPLFGSKRAELIAITEMRYVASAVHKDQMIKYGIEKWIWDAFDDGVTCDICLDLNAQSKKEPFGLDDPMPPDPSHPRCRCGMYYVGVDVVLDKFLSKGGPGSGRYPAGSGGGEKSPRGGAPRIYKKVKDAKKDLDPEYAKWMKGLSDEERTALRNYTDDYGGEINRKLRANEKLSPEEQEMVDSIDSALQTAKLAETTRVYRGMKDAWDIIPEDAKAGDVLSDDGFVSTSALSKNAMNYAGWYGAEISVNLPKGSPAAWLEGLTVGKNECELLLPRGTSYIINTIQRTHNFIYIDATLATGVKKYFTESNTMLRKVDEQDKHNERNSRFMWYPGDVKFTPSEDDLEKGGPGSGRYPAGSGKSPSRTIRISSTGGFSGTMETLSAGNAKEMLSNIKNRDDTMVNPFNPRMTTFLTEDGEVMANVELSDNTRFMEGQEESVYFNITVPEDSRGKGYGTKVMNELKGEADNANVALVGEPSAFGSGSKLSTKQLWSWYKDLGFDKEGDRVVYRPNK